MNTKSTHPINGQVKCLQNPLFYPRRLNLAAILRTTCLALACAAIVGTCLSTTKMSSSTFTQSVVAAANLGTPIVLTGSTSSGLPLTFTISASPLHGILSQSGTGP